MPEVRRIATIVLCAVCALAGIAFAGSSAEQRSDDGEPVVRIHTTMAASYKVDAETWLFQTLGDETNTTIEPIVIPSDAYRVKLVTLVSSGDIPEIILSRAPGDAVADIIDTYGPRGLFVRFNESWDSIPNVKSYFDNFDGSYKSTTSADGNIYQVPVFNENLSAGVGFEVRGDLLEQAGYDMFRVDTLDDVTDMLRVLKEINDGEPVISMRFGWEEFIGYVASWFGTGPVQYYSQTTNQFEFGPVGRNYRVMLDTLKLWYDEGLLHPDFATMEDAVLESSYRAGELLGIIDGMGWDISSTTPGAVQQIIKTPIINGERVQLPISGQINFSRPWSVSSDSPNVEAALRVVDYLYSENGKYLPYIGVKGDTWVENDDTAWGGYFTFKVWDYNQDATDLPTYADLGLANAYMTRVYPALYGPNVSNLSTKGRVTRFMDLYQDAGSLGVPIPELTFTESELEELSRLSNQLKSTVDQYSIRYVLGLGDAGTWNEFVDTAQSLGYERLIEIYNTALARYRG